MTPILIRSTADCRTTACWVGQSEYPGGITNAQWENLFNGDGFYTFVDPADPDYVYAEYQGGHVGRINRHTLEARIIQPKAELQGEAALQLEHAAGRFA